MAVSPSTTTIALALSALLALAPLATSMAIAAPEPCAAPTGGFAITGPTVLYGFVGTPLASAPFTTDSAGTVAWRGDCLALPDGVAFDQATLSYVGTPTLAGNEIVSLLAADGDESAGWDAFLDILPASALQVVMTDAAGEPLDLDDLQRGAAYQLRGAGLPGGTLVSAFLDGDPIGNSSATDDGRFTLGGTIAPDAAVGAHDIDVEFVMPDSGQRYLTGLTMTVRVLTVSGPTALTVISGVPVEYSFTTSDANGPVSYTIVGTLPGGLSLDGVNGTISGTTSGPGPLLPLQIVATDARGSATHDFTLDVLAPETVIPAFSLTADSGAGLSAAYQSAVEGGQTPEQALDHVAEERRPKSPGTNFLVSVDPETGESHIFIASNAPGATHPPSGNGVDHLIFGTSNAAAQLQFEDLADGAERDAVAAAAAFDAAEQKAALEATIRLAQEEAAARAATAGDAIANAEALRLAREAGLRELAADIEKQRALQQQAAADQLALLAAQRALMLALAAEANPLPEGTDVTIEMHSTPVLLASTRVGSSGGFALRVAPPANMSPGLHHLVVTYRLPDGSVHTNSTPITVLATGAALLPPTGAPVAPALLAGLTALVAGLGLSLTPRRRKRALPTAG